MLKRLRALFSSPGGAGQHQRPHDFAECRLAAAALLSLFACRDSGQPPASDDDSWSWDLPAHFPTPRVPDDNPMSAAKVELGRLLFYDTRMSADETFSCGSCHEQALAFTDGAGRAVGSTGEVHPRGAMSLVNLAYLPRLNWANPIVDSLEVQALGPLFSETPVELGMAGLEDELLTRFASDPVMRARFEAAFPDSEVHPTLAQITGALAAFQRTLISGTSRYDAFVLGDDSALTADEQRGMELFFSERLECFHCHGGTFFTDSQDHGGLPVAEVSFHNNGLYNLDGEGAYPPDNRGLFELTGEPSDMGRFRAPTLRNIEVTAPYFHDGSALTLDDVLDHYARGGREITSGPNVGDGRDSPLKSEFVQGFVLSDEERAQLLAFLRSLTDPSFLTNPRFADPYAAPAP